MSGVSYGGYQRPDSAMESEEAVAFALHINAHLKHVPTLKNHLPLVPGTMDIFRKQNDGLILLYLINEAVPGTLNERDFHKRSNMNIFKKTENLNLAIDAAIEIGCHVVNIGSFDILKENQVAILGLLWQIIRLQMFSGINLYYVPELEVLLDKEKGETTDDLLELSPERILTRWMNYHLRRAGEESVTTGGMANPKAFCAVLHQLDPKKCPLPSAFVASNPHLLAGHALHCARAMGVTTLTQPQELLSGSSRLAMVFAGQIFNKKHGLVLERDDDDESRYYGDDEEYEEYEEYYEEVEIMQDEEDRLRFKAAQATADVRDGDLDSHLWASEEFDDVRRVSLTEVIPAEGQTYEGESRVTFPASDGLPRDEDMYTRMPKWSKHFSEEYGIDYYFNNYTGESLWEEPEDYDGDGDRNGNADASKGTAAISISVAQSYAAPQPTQGAGEADADTMNASYDKGDSFQHVVEAPVVFESPTASARKHKSVHYAARYLVPTRASTMRGREGEVRPAASARSSGKSTSHSAYYDHTADSDYEDCNGDIDTSKQYSFNHQTGSPGSRGASPRGNRGESPRSGNRDGSGRVKNLYNGNELSLDGGDREGRTRRTIGGGSSTDHPNKYYNGDNGNGSRGGNAGATNGERLDGGGNSHESDRARGRGTERGIEIEESTGGDPWARESGDRERGRSRERDEARRRGSSQAPTYSSEARSRSPANSPTGSKMQRKYVQEQEGSDTNSSPSPRREWNTSTNLHSQDKVHAAQRQEEIKKAREEHRVKCIACYMRMQANLLVDGEKGDMKGNLKCDECVEVPSPNNKRRSPAKGSGTSPPKSPISAHMSIKDYINGPVDLSPRTDNVFERSAKMVKNRQDKAEVMRKLMEDRAGEGVTLQPSLTKRSKEIDRRVEDMMHWDTARKAKIEKRRKEIDEIEEARYTGQPKLLSSPARRAQTRSTSLSPSRDRGRDPSARIGGGDRKTQSPLHAVRGKPATLAGREFDSDRTPSPSPSPSRQEEKVWNRLHNYSTVQRNHLLKSQQEFHSSARQKSTPSLAPKTPAMARRSVAKKREGNVGERLYDLALQRQEEQFVAEVCDSREHMKDPNTGQRLFQPQISKMSKKLAAKKSAKTFERVEDLLLQKGQKYEQRRQQRSMLADLQAKVMATTPKVNPLSDRIVNERMMYGGETVQRRLSKPTGAVRQSVMQTIDQPTFHPEINRRSASLVRRSARGYVVPDDASGSSRGSAPRVGNMNNVILDTSAELWRAQRSQSQSSIIRADSSDDNMQMQMQGGPDDQIYMGGEGSDDGVVSLSQLSRSHSDTAQSRGSMNTFGQGVNGVAQRSVKWASDREAKLELERRQQERDAVKDLTFRPQLRQSFSSEGVRRDSTESADMLEKNTKWMLQREEKLAAQRKAKADEELAQCSFKPRTPQAPQSRRETSTYAAPTQASNPPPALADDQWNGSTQLDKDRENAWKNNSSSPAIPRHIIQAQKRRKPPNKPRKFVSVMSSDMKMPMPAGGPQPPRIKNDDLSMSLSGWQSATQAPMQRLRNDTDSMLLSSWAMDKDLHDDGSATSQTAATVDSSYGSRDYRFGMLQEQSDFGRRSPSPPAHSLHAQPPGESRGSMYGIPPTPAAASAAPNSLRSSLSSASKGGGGGGPMMATMMPMTPPELVGMQQQNQQRQQRLSRLSMRLAARSAPLSPDEGPPDEAGGGAAQYLSPGEPSPPPSPPSIDYPERETSGSYANAGGRQTQSQRGGRSAVAGVTQVSPVGLSQLRYQHIAVNKHIDGDGDAGAGDAEDVPLTRASPSASSVQGAGGVNGAPHAAVRTVIGPSALIRDVLPPNTFIGAAADGVALVGGVGRGGNRDRERVRGRSGSGSGSGNENNYKPAMAGRVDML